MDFVYGVSAEGLITGVAMGVHLLKMKFRGLDKLRRGLFAGM
jgi:hypothetical protein